MTPKPTLAQVAEIAAAIYRREAAGYGDAGEHKPFSQLGPWEQKRYGEIVAIVIGKWEAVRERAIAAEEAGG